MEISTIDDVKQVLETAAKVERVLPPVKVMGAKALWPEIILTDAEKKAIRHMSDDGEPGFSPTQEQIDLWYTVCSEWIKAFQGSDLRRQQWKVIWLKACGCRVKTIERHVSFGRTKIWYQYERGMAHLLNYLQVSYTRGEISSLEPYKPELVKAYPRGKITGMAKINILKEWLAELEGKK